MHSPKVAIAGSAAVLIAAAEPATAHPVWPHHLHGFWAGPGLVFGLAGAAIAAGVAAGASCVRYEPVYDANGVYLGRRAVNMC